MFEYVKMLYNSTTRADRALIVTVSAAALLMAVLFLLPARTGSAAFAVVEQDGQEIVRLRLDREESVRISCADGYNVVTVKGGSVSVTEADCRDQICVRQGSITTRKESIVCLPHRLSVHLEGASEGNGPDAVTN